MDGAFLESLECWTDFDIAQFRVGVALGLFSDADGAFVAAKHLFWTNTRTGNVLFEVLLRLVELGVLEENEDNQFRRAQTVPSLR